MPLETDPIDILVNENNDIVFVNGDLVFSKGIEAIVQSCRIALQMFQGEWFLNLDAGIPYWESILGQKPATAIQAAQIYMKSALESIEGVTKVTKFDVVYDNTTRTLNVEWQVATSFGETPLDEITLRVTTGGV